MVAGGGSSGRLRVAIEGGAFTTEPPTGVARYVAAITQQLGLLEDIDVALIPPVSAPIPGRLRNGLSRIAFALRTWRNGSFDVVLFPNFVRIPTIRRVANVVIVYDVSFELHQEFAARRTRAFLHRQVPKALRHATRIVTISDAARSEIVDHYRMRPEDVIVVAPGVDRTHFHPKQQTEIDQVAARHDIVGRYVLFVGTLEPRKGIEDLLDAFGMLPVALRDQYVLVVVGGPGWRDEAIMRRFNRHAEFRLVRTGYAPDDELPALYSGAELFVYPSRYEGFGLPALEAMACGAPVVVTEGLPVVDGAGDVGEVFASGDIQGLARAMERVLSDPARASLLRENGANYARGFSWQASAEALREVLVAAARETR